MQPASSARHTDSLQRRRQQQQLHVGRRWRPTAATAPFAKARSRRRQRLLPPSGRELGVQHLAGSSVHLRPALPLRSPPLPHTHIHLPAPLSACLAPSLGVTQGNREGAGGAARQESCPQPGPPPRRAPGRLRGRRQRSAARCLFAVSPGEEGGVGRWGGLRKVEGVEGGVSPLAGNVSPSRGGAEGAGGGGPGERRPLAPARGDAAAAAGSGSGPGGGAWQPAAAGLPVGPCRSRGGGDGGEGVGALRGCPLWARRCSPPRGRGRHAGGRGEGSPGGVGGGSSPVGGQHPGPGKEDTAQGPRPKPKTGESREPSSPSSAVARLHASLQGRDGPVDLRPSHWALLSGGLAPLTGNRARIYCPAVVTIL